MATTVFTLTPTYQLISAAGITVSSNSGDTIYLFNGDAQPADDDIGHKVIPGGEAQLFPKPNSGSWYAKSTSDNGKLVVTEV